MGTHAMRTGAGGPIPYEAVPPGNVKAFPKPLRRAGYATANFAKKDYQFGEHFTVWGVDVGHFMSPLEPAPWRQLPEDKPFFVMMNLMSTHESRLVSSENRYEGQWAAMMGQISDWRAKHVIKITDSAAVEVPPYYPDTARVRGSIAQHYDNIHYMDSQVGQILAALKEDGLADNTIVIWTTDHGDALSRAKRAVYDTGIRVPMVVRFSDGAGRGEICNKLVSFVDLAPTILNLVGAAIPDFIQGQDFLQGKPRDFVYAARDRMDAVLDRQRAVRDDRFKYIRNYRPELSYFRPLAFHDMSPIMRELCAGVEDEGLSPLQQFYFSAPRPVEELYDTEVDPHETRNLAASADYQAVLKRLRGELDSWLNRVGDKGAVPEADMIADMWPGLVQPVTTPPEAEASIAASGETRWWLHSATNGASIGYRIDAGPWQVYSRPLTLKADQVLEAKAIRYSYRESGVAQFNDEKSADVGH